MSNHIVDQSNLQMGELPSTFNPGQFITDGYENYWPIKCPYCGKKSMIIVRPGWASCDRGCDEE